MYYEDDEEYAQYDVYAGTGLGLRKTKRVKASKDSDILGNIDQSPMPVSEITKELVVTNNDNKDVAMKQAVNKDIKVDNTVQIAGYNVNKNHLMLAAGLGLAYLVFKK